VAKHYNVLRMERHDKINIFALKRHQTFGRINNSGYVNPAPVKRESRRELPWPGSCSKSTEKYDIL
jgi:hypothetical protein